MSYDAKILADSVSPSGCRLTTMQVSFPRIVLAEFNTHRVFSRNSASSRAIPVEKMLARVLEDPFVPGYWGKNQKGMQAEGEIGQLEAGMARRWLIARDEAVARTRYLQELGVHKQIANRLLEPFLWHTVIVTATEWENFFNLRCHKDAQPEIREIAVRMRDLYEASRPTERAAGFWHVPLVDEEDADAVIAGCKTLESIERGGWIEEAQKLLARISSARCARVSYLTHEGRRDIAADLKLADQLERAGHMSPFEHAAVAEEHAGMVGNFRGWRQYRKFLPDEACFRGAAS